MSRRKVLWFINKVPEAVAEAAGAQSVRGGWLDQYVRIASAEPSIELTVAYPDQSGRVPRAEIGGVTYVGLPTWERPSRIGRVVSRWRHDVAPRRVLAAATRLIEDVRPDLIHLHGAEYCYGLATRGCGVPTVLSIQGSPTAIRQRYRHGIDRYFLRSISTASFLKGRGPVHDHLRMSAQAANEATIMASVGHVAGRTEWDRQLASDMAPQAVYHHLDEPVRRAFHEAAWNPQGESRGRIVCTSGDYALKGVGTLLRAMDVLRHDVPTAHLTLVGVLGEEHRRATVRHVRALDLADRVTLTGEVDAEALAGMLTQADVFVIASHMENSSSALSEAQLVGVPCVASSVGGLVTLAGNGSAALLFPDTDPVALAGAVQSLIEHPDEAARLGARGRELARVRHDESAIRTQLLAIYDEVLA